MPLDHRIHEMMSLWEQGRTAGRTPTPEQLCREHPELLQELKNKLRLLESADQLLGTKEQHDGMNMDPKKDTRKPAFSELDRRIALLAAAVDPAVRADLQKALATLRQAHNVPGTLTTLSRLLEKSSGLLPIMAQAAGVQVRATTLEKQIDELRGKVIPAEIASDLHWIRVRANKARHGDEALTFNLADGEMALHLALKAVEWHYCRSQWGPKLATVLETDADVTAAPAPGRDEAQVVPSGPHELQTPHSLLQRLRRPVATDRTDMDVSPALAPQRYARDWSRFNHLFAPVLCAIAERLCPADDDAKELLSEMYITIRDKIAAGKYDSGKGRFRDWLRVVARNKWHEILRKRAVRDKGKRELAEEPAVPDNVEDFFEREYATAVYARALDILQNEFQPATWQAFTQVAIEERSAADVARDLGMTTGAVYAARFRVLARLRQELAGLLD